MQWTECIARHRDNAGLAFALHVMPLPHEGRLSLEGPANSLDTLRTAGEAGGGDDRAAAGRAHRAVPAPSAHQLAQGTPGLPGQLTHVSCALNLKNDV